MELDQVTKSSKPPERSITISRLPFVYMHLSLHNTSDPNYKSSLDPISVRTYLTAALQQYLGLTGTAIPLDIVKVEGASAWIRLPQEEGRAVQGALSQWLSKDGSFGWRVQAVGSSITALSQDTSRRLFDP